MIISFVIPTFNFAAFLPDTLDSIVDEGYAPIEIIVFDGGSSDNTLEVLADYRCKFPALKIISAAQRGNIDTDLNAAVAAATGDYVWTMSSDDVLMPGWSRQIAGRIERLSPDIMLVPAIHGDLALRPRRNYPILRHPGAGDLLQSIDDDDALIAYLAKVRTSEGLFSFCSACLIRREKLLETPQLEPANGTCWRYAGRMIAALVRYPTKILVLDTPLLIKRGENDSFAHGGIIRRLRIATCNWDDTIRSLALNARLGTAMLSLLKSDIPPTSLLYLSQFVRDPEEQAIFHACVRSRLGGGGAAARVLARLLVRMPRFSFLQSTLTQVRPIYRTWQQRRWHARLPGDADRSVHKSSKLEEMAR